MRDYLERIKEDLDMFDPNSIMITVVRKDLEKLVSAYENLLRAQSKKVEFEIKR